MDEREFSRRVKARERQLYRVSYAILQSDSDAADAVQEALVHAWLRIGALREERYFETWLTRILINECKRLLKKRRAHPLPLPESLPAPPPPDARLAEAVALLPPKERLALVLHHLEGYPVEEIAQMLRVPSGTVKSRLSRARARLKEQLSEEGWA